MFVPMMFLQGPRSCWAACMVLLGSSVVVPAQASKLQAARTAPVLQSVSLLNEVGQLRGPISPSQISEWKAALHRRYLPAQTAAQLHIRLGEWERAANEQPALAIWHFCQARRLLRPSDAAYGLATYDQAEATYYEGAYTEAYQAFGRLLEGRPVLHGFDRKDCAMWYRHAGACAGYHQEHARLGIPEPLRLDRFCGAAALAVCLRGNGLPFTRSTVLSVCRVTGQGSGIADVMNAAARLGVAARSLTADDEGLRALPMPVVAFVEHDHFVGLVKADASGVSYVCSDCGPWPGGRVNLTWKQWHAMNAGIYVTVAPLHGAADRWVESALAGRRVRPYGHDDRACANISRGCLAAFRWQSGGQTTYCGGVPTSQHCGLPQCPVDGSGCNGDPVNLATGEEEYHPEPDLTVYNPRGPSVVWGRIYNSLRSLDEPGGSAITPFQSPVLPNSPASKAMILIGNQFDDYGVGWSDTYNVKVYDSGGVTDTKYLILENGAAIPFSASAAPSTANPVVPCTLPPGANFLAEWDFEAASGAHLFKFTYPDRTQWTFSTVLKNRYQPVYSLSSITDRNGHSIYFRYDMGYGPPEVPTDNVYLALSAYLLLTRITDDSGNPLLTINRAQDGSGLIKSISDRYGRTVVYQSSSHPTAGVPQSWPQYHYDLDVVSQIVPTGTLAPPMRMQYGYANYPDLEGTELTPFLHTITFPSPTGKGASTETINYSTANLAVTSTVDANGVVHKYSSVDGNHVKVTITDSKGNLAYSYTVGFDNNMSQTTRTDGTNTTVVDSRTLSDPNNPYKPSTVTDGNGNITAYSWDQFGNLQSRTSPYGTRTTLTWSYTRFALGELSRIQEGSKTPLTLGYHEPSGLLATLTAPQPGTVGDGKTVVTSITYDSLGNPLTIVQPGNNATATRTTTFNYQTDGAYSQTAAYGQPIVITDNLGHSTHYRYDPRAEMISVTDALGNQTNLGYNLAGQILQIAYPALSDVTASVAVSRSALTYSGATQTYSGSLTLTNAGHATFTGRIAAVLTNLTPGITLVNPYGSYEGNPYLLSAAGTLAPKQSVTLPITLSNPKSLAVSYGVQAYLTDAHGAPASMNARVAAGYLYPGGPLLQAALYDEAGSVLRSVSRAYGPEGETLSVTGSANSLGVRYDGDYRVTTILDGNGHATHYSYNTAGYLHDVTYPLGDLVRYPKYDRNGNVLQRIDGRGIETDYVYNDPASRLTDVQYHSTGKYTGLEALDVHVSYDEYSRVIGFTDGSGSTARAYDDLNKLLSVTTTYTGPNGKALPAVTIDYGFYPDGSRASMDITSGTAKYPFSYGFDKVSRLVSLVNPGGTTEQWSYFDNGWVKSRQTAQGAAGLYSYNARGFLNDLTYYAPDGSLLADFGEMTYDASGSRLTLSALNPARPAYSGFTGYTYDSKNQLTLEQSTRNGGYTNSFAYDLAGNATQFRGNARTYNTENQRTGSGFAYDGNGNPTSYAYTSLAFDPENHMTSFGSALTAGYRADGLRAWKRSASGQTYFVYSGIVPVCEMDSTGNVTAVNTFGRDGLVSRDTAAGEQVYAFDPQGSAALALSTSGAVQASMMLDAFGAGAGQSTPYGGFGSRWGYYSDAETSVPLLGLRHYDPAIGRFMTRDPIGANGGVNFYRYVSNDAPNLADPLGLCAKSGSQQPPWDGSNPWNWPPDLWPGSSGPPLPPNPIGGGPLAPWPDNNGNTGPPMSGEPALIIAEAGAMHAGFELAEALSPNPVLEWLGTSALLYDAYRLFSEPRPSPSDDDGQHTGTAGPGNLPLPPPTIFGSPWPP